jgi:hypothetical protein
MTWARKYRNPGRPETAGQRSKTHTLPATLPIGEEMNKCTVCSHHGVRRYEVPLIHPFCDGEMK